MNEQPFVEDVRLTTEPEALAREIEDHLIAYASPAARMEWDALRARWPLAGQRRHSAELDEELEIAIVKVRRFKAILGSISERQQSAKG